MKSLATILRSLETKQFLLGTVKENGNITNIELLPNGQRYSKQFLLQWQQNPVTNSQTTHIVDDVIEETYDHSSILGFLNSPVFRANIGLVNKCGFSKNSSTIIKSKFLMKASPLVDAKSALQFSSSSLACNGITHLVTDYFCHQANSLTHFYNIQRERKIWWMRFSANPSRYLLESRDLAMDRKAATIPKIKPQSIAIKSRFPFGTFDLENITLTRLNEKLIDGATNKPIRSAVIHSVIDLSVATCAMLLDGYDHGRSQSLLINGKMAPYQCTIAIFHTADIYFDDLHDLYYHISQVLRSAGLRVFDEHNIVTNSSNTLTTELEIGDSMGIPYALVLTDDTLQNGLIQLRSRDTTLKETIHISDIPEYLLKIFNS